MMHTAWPSVTPCRVTPTQIWQGRKGFIEVATSPVNKFIRATCKLLAECSDKGYAKAVTFGGWAMEEYDLTSPPLRDLPSICGARHGVYHMAAGVIDREWDKIEAFLEEEQTIETAPGQLRAEVLAGCRSKTMRAGVRTKSMLCKPVYFKWMRTINRVTHYFDMAPHAQTAAARLDSWAADALPLLNGVSALFDEWPVAPSVDEIRITEALRRDDEAAALVKVMLEASCKPAGEQLRKHTAILQPGGRYSNPTQLQRSKAAALPLTTHHVEGGIGVLQHRKGRARHEHLRNASGYAKLVKNLSLFDEFKKLPTAEQRRVYAEAKLQDARRVQREGGRATIMRAGAAANKAYRAELKAKAVAKAARAAQAKAAVEATVLLHKHTEVHGLTINSLKAQLRK